MVGGEEPRKTLTEGSPLILPLSVFFFVFFLFCFVLLLSYGVDEESLIIKTLKFVLFLLCFSFLLKLHVILMGELKSSLGKTKQKISSFFFFQIYILFHVFLYSFLLIFSPFSFALLNGE